MSEIITKERRRATESVVILLGDNSFFAGFGSDIVLKKAIVRSTGVLGDAQTISASNPSKVADYIRRLTEKGYQPTAMKLTISGPYDPAAVSAAQDKERHHANS